MLVAYINEIMLHILDNESCRLPSREGCETRAEKEGGKKMEKKQPLKKFRAGAIAATIWENPIEKEGKTTVYNTISFERGYKDKDGVWKSTSSLRTADLPKAVVVLSKAYEYLVLQDKTAVIEEQVI